MFDKHRRNKCLPWTCPKKDDRVFVFRLLQQLDLSRLQYLHVIYLKIEDMETKVINKNSIVKQSLQNVYSNLPDMALHASLRRMYHHLYFQSLSPNFQELELPLSIARAVLNTSKLRPWRLTTMGGALNLLE